MGSIEKSASLNWEVRPLRPDEVVPIRHAVLWPDLPVERVLLPEDRTGIHFGAFAGTCLVSVNSLFLETLADGRIEARFRKFATLPDWQGKGAGTALMNQVIGESRRTGAWRIWCNARLDALDFYRRFGMQVCGTQAFADGKGYVPLELRLREGERG